MITRTSSAALAALALLAALGLPAVSFAQDAPPAEGAEKPAEGAEKPAEGAEKPAEPAADIPADASKTEADLSEVERTAYDGHLRAGKGAYAKKDYATALTQFEAAHNIFPKPSILFNMALISEKGGQLEAAVGHYQKFVEAPGVTLENRQRASERMKAIQEILASSESAEKQQQMTDLLPALEAMGIQSLDEAAEPTTTETTQTTAENATTTETTETAPPPATPDVKYTWPVYAAFGTATAALAGGVVMVAMTNNRIDEGKTAALEGDLAEHAAAEDDASLYATSAAGLFAGGAVLAIVGSYFVVRNSQAAETEAAASNADAKASLSFSLDKNFLGPIFSLKF